MYFIISDFTISEDNGYIEEKNGSKYLIFASTDKKSIKKVHRSLKWD